MKYSVEIPNGWKMNLAMIKDPVEAYEAMTNVAKAADEDGYESIWMVDHFHTVPTPSQEVTFETWMSLAARRSHSSWSRSMAMPAMCLGTWRRSGINSPCSKRIVSRWDVTSRRST